MLVLPNSLLWDPLDKSRVTTTDAAAIRQWDVSTLQQTVELKGGELDNFTSGAPVPTKGNQFAVACNDTVKFFDLSAGKYVLELFFVAVEVDIFANDGCA